MSRKIHTVKVGQRFGSWTIRGTESFLRPDGYYSICECHCGKLALVQIRAMIGGRSNSCGCRVVEKSEVAMERLWKIWTKIPAHKTSWADWGTFRKWALYTGYSKKAKLRMRDASLGYTENNCYWEDARRRQNRLPDYVPGGWHTS